MVVERLYGPRRKSDSRHGEQDNQRREVRRVDGLGGRIPALLGQVRRVRRARRERAQPDREAAIGYQSRPYASPLRCTPRGVTEQPGPCAASDPRGLSKRPSAWRSRRASAAASGLVGRAGSSSEAAKNHGAEWYGRRQCPTPDEAPDCSLRSMVKRRFAPRPRASLPASPATTRDRVGSGSTRPVGGNVARAPAARRWRPRRRRSRAPERAGSMARERGAQATTHASAVSDCGGWRARRDSNPRPSGPQPDALSTELRAHVPARQWRRGRDSNPRSRLPHLAV